MLPVLIVSPTLTSDVGIKTRMGLTQLKNATVDTDSAVNNSELADESINGILNPKFIHL